MENDAFSNLENLGKKIKDDARKYSDRLQTIKECGLVDVIKQLSKDKVINLQAIIDDVEWLIYQAEKVEKLAFDYDDLTLKIEELKNELTGFKLSNQSLSNSLDKEIKENEKLAEAKAYIERQKEYIGDLENEISLLYKRLNQIRELCGKELK